MNLNQRQLDALEHLADHYRKAAELVSQLPSRDYLKADWKAGYALTRCVEVIGKAATCLGPQFHDAHPQVPWRWVVGTGDRLVRDYDKVDNTALWQTASEGLPELYRQIVLVQQATLPEYLCQFESLPENLGSG